MQKFPLHKDAFAKFPLAQTGFVQEIYCTNGLVQGGSLVQKGGAPITLDIYIYIYGKSSFVEGPKRAGLQNSDEFLRNS